MIVGKQRTVQYQGGNLDFKELLTRRVSKHQIDLCYLNSLLHIMHSSSCGLRNPLLSCYAKHKVMNILRAIQIHVA